MLVFLCSAALKTHTGKVLCQFYLYFINLSLFITTFKSFILISYLSNSKPLTLSAFLSFSLCHIVVGYCGGEMVAIVCIVYLLDRSALQSVVVPSQGVGLDKVWKEGYDGYA